MHRHLADARSLCCSGVLGLAIVALSGITVAAAETAVSLSRHGDWALMSNDAAPRTVCFVVTEVKETEPKGLNREPAYFYVSRWPKEGVKAEISIKLGYKPRKGSDATLIVNGAGFKLQPHDDRLYVDDATRELKLLEALRKAPNAKLAATSDRGTQILDVFSLTGLTEAIQALAAACP